MLKLHSMHRSLVNGVRFFLFVATREQFVTSARPGCAMEGSVLVHTPVPVPCPRQTASNVTAVCGSMV